MHITQDKRYLHNYTSNSYLKTFQKGKSSRNVSGKTTDRRLMFSRSDGEIKCFVNWCIYLIKEKEIEFLILNSLTFYFSLRLIQVFVEGTS